MFSGLISVQNDHIDNFLSAKNNLHYIRTETLDLNKNRYLLSKMTCSWLTDEVNVASMKLNGRMKKQKNRFIRLRLPNGSAKNQVFSPSYLQQRTELQRLMSQLGAGRTIVPKRG